MSPSLPATLWPHPPAARIESRPTRPALRILSGGRTEASDPESKDLPHGVPAGVILAAQAGDLEAFTAIVHEYQQLVFGTVFRLISGRHRDQVEDVTQDIFLRLFRVLPRFDIERGTRFSTWLLTLVKNHCYDVLKKRRVTTVSMHAAHEEEGPREPAAPTRDPAHTLHADEIRTAVADAVGRLPPSQRLVFVLREYEGLSYLEIAEVAGCSEGTVKSRLHRAKEALKLRLAPLYADA